MRLPTATRSTIVLHRAEVSALTALGSETAPSRLAAPGVQTAADPDPIPEVQQPVRQPCSFDETAAYDHAAALAGLGTRVAGTTAEHRAFDYITTQLRCFGYSVTMQSFVLPNGRTSHNVIAEKTGAEPRFIVLGAHVDTKYPSPGANDNGSGVGTVLELARALSMTETIPSLRFVFFGAEEMIDSNPAHHHYGSTHYVATLSEAQKAAISGMVSVDMVGYGTDYHARTMLLGPQSMSTLAMTAAAREGIEITFLKDTGVYGWSDHEPFERSGIPAVWLEWREDPLYHTRGDKAVHLNKGSIKTTGDHLAGLIVGMTPAEMP